MVVISRLEVAGEEFAELSLQYRGANRLAPFFCLLLLCFVCSLCDYPLLFWSVFVLLELSKNGKEVCQHCFYILLGFFLGGGVGGGATKVRAMP